MGLTLIWLNRTNKILITIINHRVPSRRPRHFKALILEIEIFDFDFYLIVRNN
jgi:hypothetical protein